MILAIYGASGLGVEFHGLANRINKEENKWTSVIYVDDDPNKAGTELKGSKVYPYEQAIKEFGKENLEFILGIGEPNVKDLVFDKLGKNGCTITSLVLQEDREFLTENEVYGKGLVLHRLSGLPPYCRFGNNVLIQGKAVMGHNLVLGDNVVISSLSFVGGDVTVGRNTYIAPGSCIRNGLHIGENAIIGMGAVVTKDVPDNAVVVGNPAKVLRYNDKGRVFSK